MKRQFRENEIYIVDDDPAVGELLASLFSAAGFKVASFTDGNSFVAATRKDGPATVLMDVVMPGRSGLDLLKDIDAASYDAPIIIMSGNASIPMAVDAIKSGAFDIIEKPFDPKTIVARVRELTDGWKTQHENGLHSNSKGMEFPGVERLTQREREVLAEITAAASNKEAGRHLGLSPRTIEVHRAHIMMKLGAKNTADLVRMVLSKRPIN